MTTTMTFADALKHYYDSNLYTPAQLEALAGRRELCWAWENWVDAGYQCWLEHNGDDDGDEFKNLDNLVCSFFENDQITVTETYDVWDFLYEDDAVEIDGPYFWFEIDDYISGVLQMIQAAADDDDNDDNDDDT